MDDMLANIKAFAESNKKAEQDAMEIDVEDSTYETRLEQTIADLQSRLEEHREALEKVKP